MPKSAYQLDIYFWLVECAWWSHRCIHCDIMSRPFLKIKLHLISVTFCLWSHWPYPLKLPTS